MRVLIILLSYLFSALEALTALLVFPLTVICGLGLLGFTFKIAHDMKNQKSVDVGPPQDLPGQMA
jgi:hypothetical protein